MKLKGNRWIKRVEGGEGRESDGNEEIENRESGELTVSLNLLWADFKKSLKIERSRMQETMGAYSSGNVKEKSRKKVRVKNFRKIYFLMQEYLTINRLKGFLVVK